MPAPQYFQSLDPRLQRWVYRKGWSDLNSLQQNAIPPILSHDKDVVISAATAGGKTEAAFLPALTYIAKESRPGVRILYISPLKALINDQYRRLLDLCDPLDIKVTPWHGDISGHVKRRQFTAPSGVILVTPESLESLLLNHTAFVKEGFASLDYVIIDEFHAFMAGERGAQLQSQLHRIENLVGHLIVRVALSATFSNFEDVAIKVRPHHPERVLDIKPTTKAASQLSLKVHGYVSSVEEIRDEEQIDISASSLKNLELHYPSAYAISKDIFRLMRGQVNLVFTNAKHTTERIAAILMRMSEHCHVPNEFFPHHGSLSREAREDVESRLIKGELPTTAICTATLELGIDISDVVTIGQIQAPFSVASLRQRLGRSGRRNGRATLRMFVYELPEGISLSSDISEELVTSMAMVELLLQHWYEPPPARRLFVSTLVQQTLSVVASIPRTTAKALYELLCKTGPFSMVTLGFYALILKALGENDLLVQLGDGSLTLGLKGEEVVSDWGFYAAFNSVQEYRIVHNGKEIGTTPLLGDPEALHTFLLGGKGWEIIDIDRRHLVITVKRYDKDCNPLPALSNENPVHEKIRLKMVEIYERDDEPPYLNVEAKELLRRARRNYRNLGLKQRHIVETPLGIALFPWSDNGILRTLRLLLLNEHVSVEIVGSHLELQYISRESLSIAIAAILRRGEEIEPEELLKRHTNIELEKFITYLNPKVKRLNYFYDQCDIPGALNFLRNLAKELR